MNKDLLSAISFAVIFNITKVKDMQALFDYSESKYRFYRYEGKGPRKFIRDFTRGCDMIITSPQLIFDLKEHSYISMGIKSQMPLQGKSYHIFQGYDYRSASMYWGSFKDNIITVYDNKSSKTFTFQLRNIPSGKQ